MTKEAQPTLEEIDLLLWQLLGTGKTDTIRYWYGELMRMKNEKKRHRKRKKIYGKSGVPRVHHLRKSMSGPSPEKRNGNGPKKLSLHDYRAMSLPSYG